MALGAIRGDKGCLERKWEKEKVWENERVRKEEKEVFIERKRKKKKELWGMWRDEGDEESEEEKETVGNYWRKKWKCENILDG